MILLGLLLFALIVALIAGAVSAWDKASPPRVIMTAGGAFAATVALGVAVLGVMS